MESKIKIKNIIPREKPLSIPETCLSGLIMGFIAYSGSFSVVPIIFTFTALTFGTKSLITILATAFGQLTAGYLHTHSSRTGIAISTNIFHGFYIAKPKMRNRRQYNETRWESLKRFFILNPLNGLILNFMWQTFTIFYFLQSEVFLIYLHNSISKKTENETISLSSTNELETRLILFHGITRYLAGCLSGISTGIINHLWQRYLARAKNPQAIFNTNREKLKLDWKDRKKILSPYNMENWIKVFVMLGGALFIILSNIPNITGLHLLELRNKRFIGDFLVINSGWFFLRDCQMFLFKKAEKDPSLQSNAVQTPLIVEETKTIDDNPSGTLINVV
jgi:hypothetical protein